MWREVVGFVHQKNNRTCQIVCVLVKFDDPVVGIQAIKTSPTPIFGAVGITKSAATFNLDGKGALEVTRNQVPLNLALATTIHNVQGLSLDNIVVSFERTFRCGQAYVALSRAKTLKGLHLHLFEKSKVLAGSEIKREMERMKYHKAKEVVQSPL